MTINPFILHGEEITPVRKLLYLKALAGGAPLSEYTVTGNPVSFNTNVAKPLSVVAAFSPVQAGSGDPNPVDNVRPITGWSGASVTRCGKNLLNPAETMDGIWYNGEHYGSGYGRYTASGYIRVEPGKKYVGTGRDSSQNQYCFFDIKKQYVSQTFASGSNPVTIPSGVYYMTTQFLKSSAEKMIEEGETATTFEEYTGESVSVTFPALGKNLFDKNAVQTGKLWWKGNKQDDMDYNASAKIPVIPGETYTIYKSTSGQNQVEFFDIDGVYTGQDLSWGTTKAIPSGVYFIAFNIRNESLDTAMLVKGTTAGEYEPYNATAYGGTLDLSTGVLTVDKKCVSLNDPDKWTQPSTNFIYDVYYNDRKQGYREGDMCSCFKTSSRSYPYLIWAGSALNRYALYPGSTGITIDDLKALSEAGSIQCCYDLETPLVYQLTPTEILSLIGSNVIWSDLNGDLTVTYKKKG